MFQINIKIVKIKKIEDKNSSNEHKNSSNENTNSFNEH